MMYGHQQRNGRGGFTLVELLVVMAIITILAAISVPRVVNFLRQGQSTRALADISGIETALTEVLADANRSSLEQLFESGCPGTPDYPCPDNVQPFGVSNFLLNVKNSSAWPPATHEDFQMAVQLYTRALTGILRSGRNVLTSTDSFGFNYSDILQDDVVRKLGTQYIDLGPDPWGNLYNIYPGPWAARDIVGTGQEERVVRAPIPFRIFDKTDDNLDMPGATSANNDGLIGEFRDIDSDDGIGFPAGYPAPLNEMAYIWSNGQNLLSSQLLYNGVGYGTLTPDQVVLNLYDPAQPDACCGGDDINNWDNGNSWGRFY